MIKSSRADRRLPDWTGVAQTPGQARLGARPCTPVRLDAPRTGGGLCDRRKKAGVQGTVEKVVLECGSLLERSGNPALRGFRCFLKSELIILPAVRFLLKPPRRALRFEVLQQPLQPRPKKVDKTRPNL